MDFPRGLRNWLVILPLSLACVSNSSIGQEDRRVRPTPVKPSLSVLPVDDQTSGTNVSASSARSVLPRVEFLDPANPDMRLLQRYDDSMRGLPMDANGFPDWMKALNEGKIQPRSGLKPGDRMEVLDLDVVMKNTKEMPYVRFPHRSHTLWLACSNCHPTPFQAKAGSSAIVMADIFRGQFCGMCHDRVAFVTFFSCQRCHNVPHQEPR